MRAYARWLFIMIIKKSLNNRLKSAIFGVFFAVFSIFSFTTISAFVNPSADVYADPAENSNTTTDTTTQNTSNNTTLTNPETTDGANNSATSSENSTSTENTTSATSADTEDNCSKQVGALGWFICPGVGVLSKAIDSIYSQIEVLLQVTPVTLENNSPIFHVWQIMRDITNILFVIALLIIVYSQVTGFGVTNYGVKKALPKLIIAAVLVNLSFIICALAVDASNILGSGLRGIFDNIQVQVINSGDMNAVSTITWTDLATALISGGVVAGFVVSAASLLFPILGAIVCALISVLIGLVTIGLRQSLISVLIMIAPLAFVCYLLPNTEKWFNKWKEIFISMLIFYPMFSVLFGASRLAGWTLIATSIANDNAFGVAIGMVVQVLPLILSIPLMKMSNTILGKASSALDNLAKTPREGIRGLASKYRTLSHNRHVNNSALPSAHLQRFLDQHNRKMELSTEYTTKIRQGRAEVWAQRAIQGSQDYDPVHNEEYKNGGRDKNGKRTRNRLRTSRLTREAKEALNYSLDTESATRDTAHILGSYGDFHKGTKRDVVLGKAGARSFFEYDRALHVEENDRFADQDWLMGKYEEMRKAGEDSYDYKHYVIGGAGSLGKVGESLVLGQVINKSAVNESKRKSYVALNLAKYGYGGLNKSEFRDFVTGYAINDDGLAVDRVTRSTTLNYKDPKTGKVIKVKERSPGEFLKYHPEYLDQCSAYTLKDENGYYFNLTDQNGAFVSRIYKNDGAAMKEVLQNWDMPIADPIDGLYGILSGTNPGALEKAGYKNLGGVGLSNFSTTLDRAIRSSGFKEKASFASPLYSTMVNQRFIQDLIHQDLARLDSLNKTAKPSSFNTQDAAEFNQLRLLMNPANWEWMLFNEDSLRSFRNVNGKKLTGTRYRTDSNGNYIKNDDGSFVFDEIAADSPDLTFDDLKRTVVRKFLAPAGQKFTNLMSRVTPNIIDNQKPGVAEPWNGLLDALETWSSDEYQDLYPGLADPMARQDNDTISRARQVSKRISPESNKGSKPQGRKNANRKNGRNQNGSHRHSQPANFAPGQEISINRPGSYEELVEASADLKARKMAAENRAAAGVYQPGDEYYYDDDYEYEERPFQPTEEDLALDREYAEFESRQAWFPFANQSQFPNYQAEIDQIAATCTDPKAFVSQVKGYLDNAGEQDPRMHEVLREFNVYVSNNEDVSVYNYKKEVEGIIASVTYT